MLVPSSLNGFSLLQQRSASSSTVTIQNSQTDVGGGSFPVRRQSLLYAKSDNDDEDDDDDDESLDGGDDWRAFRAKLVMGEKTPTAATTSSSSDEASSSTDESNDNDNDSTDNEIITDDLDGIGSIFGDEFAVESSSSSSSNTKSSLSSTTKKEKEALLTPLDPSQWAYESGDVIEQGAVILGGIEQEYGFGLRQQYFHKTVILVLDHSPSFTKGIILNRPTDLCLEDDTNNGLQWRVWFGGDVEGTNAQRPDILCLHSLKDDRAIQASNSVMKDIQWTTFENAKKLVKQGVASVSDFWVFVGYAGWGPDQLKGELERNSWYMVATDSQTLLQELARQGAGEDPRDAGLETWTLLMNMIGRSETAKENSRQFDDLMLKEWAFRNLLSDVGGGLAGKQQRAPDAFNSNPESVKQLLSLIPTKRSEELEEGSLVSASAMERSPFLLQKQEYHKSVVLIIKEDELATIGVILNRVSTKGIDIQIDDRKTGGKRVVHIPMRFGGPYSIQGSQSLLWIHCNELMREAEIGTPIGTSRKDGIWKCTTDDVKKAIGQGIARPEDFLVLSGVSVWPKIEGAGQGIQGEIELKNFELVSDESAQDNMWSILLQQQDLLKQTNFIESLKLSEEAWLRTTTRTTTKGNTNNMNPLGGLGENFDEEDDSFVFKSDYKVSQLSDDALRGWCATFLLGLPNFKI